MERLYHYEIKETNSEGQLDLGDYEKQVVEMHEAIYFESPEDAPEDPVESFYSYLVEDWAAVVLALNANNELVGYGSLKVSPEGNAGELVGELVSSYVKPEFRRNGVYKQLTRIREDLAREKGASSLNIMTHDNTQTLFLQEIGFKPSGKPESGVIYEYKKELK